MLLVTAAYLEGGLPLDPASVETPPEEAQQAAGHAPGELLG